MEFNALPTAEGHFRTIKLSHKQPHVSNLPYNLYGHPFSSQSTKPIPTQTLNKTYIHKHQTNLFEELAPSILPLLKEHIRLGDAGVVDHSVMSNLLHQVKEEEKRKREKHLFILN